MDDEKEELMMQQCHIKTITITEMAEHNLTINYMLWNEIQAQKKTKND